MKTLFRERVLEPKVLIGRNTWSNENLLTKLGDRGSFDVKDNLQRKWHKKEVGII